MAEGCQRRGGCCALPCGLRPCSLFVKGLDYSHTFTLFSLSLTPSCWARDAACYCYPDSILSRYGEFFLIFFFFCRGGIHGRFGRHYLQLRVVVWLVYREKLRLRTKAFVLVYGPQKELISLAFGLTGTQTLQWVYELDPAVVSLVLYP